MKNIVCLLVISMLLSCAASKNNRMMQFAGNPVVAHRGAFKKNGLPENSIAALREAIRLGCTGSEFDVRMTADDSLVINHDPKYHDLQIEKTLYKDLEATPLTNGEPLPTLLQFLTAGLANNTHTRLVLEIKPSDLGPARADQVASACVRVVNALQAQRYISYISFDYNILKKIRTLDATANLQYLNGDISPAQLKADGIDGVDYNLAVFRKNPSWIGEAKKNNLILNAWTVNAAEDMTWLLSENFDFITTNEPEQLLQIIKGRHKK